MPKRAAPTCELCNTPVTQTRTCYACEEVGCTACVKTACCDCSVRMCNNCREDGEPTCGCYGTCNQCGTDVNRGEHGWPCSKCEEWRCDECREKSKCKECNPPDF